MPNHSNGYRIRVEPWPEGDLTLLRELNAPEMPEHLGGPETEEQGAGAPSRDWRLE